MDKNDCCPAERQIWNVIEILEDIISGYQDKLEKYEGIKGTAFEKYECKTKIYDYMYVLELFADRGFISKLIVK